MLNQSGEEMPPCLTPFCILKLRDSLLLISNFDAPSWFISAIMATVSSLQHASIIVLYSISLLIESNAFFRSIKHQ